MTVFIPGLFVFFCSSLSANDSPAQMWGVDEDTHTLFSIGDYTKINGSGNPKVQTYGPLGYDLDGVFTILPIDPATGGHIGAVALGPDGTLYLALN